MIYDAFISYRHAPLDMEFAKKVHSGLETYHVPDAVRKKTGKKKIQRVFRDQDELPIGSDLNDNITQALRESEYLIVICSPETPGSYWVSKEIETFIALHGRQNILAVLVDGEPEQSFPALLRTDEAGNAVEPLAADVRGTTPSERNKKFKTELLRLAAPILGCTYDDLRQRHRERIVRRNLIIAAAAAGILAVAGAAFGIYNANVAARMKKLADEKAVLAQEKTALAEDKTKLADEKSRLADEKTKLSEEILAEFRQKQENQSRFYAEESLALLQEGNREDAVLVASAALPASSEDPRPYVSEAEYALAAALHVYDCGSELSNDRVLTHDLIVSRMFLDKSARYLTSIDEGGTVYSWDCTSWELLARYAAPLNDRGSHAAVVAAHTDENGTVIASANGFVRYAFSGEETARLSFGKVIKGCDIFDTYDTAVCIADDRIWIIGLSTFTVRAEILIEDGRDWFDSEGTFSGDGKYYAVGQHDLLDEDPARVTIVDLSDCSFKRVEISEQHVLGLAVTRSGCVAVVGTNNDFFKYNMTSLTMDVFRADSGEKLYSIEIPQKVRNIDTFEVLMSSQTNSTGTIILLALDTDAYIYDEATGEVKAHVTLAETASTIDLVNDSTTAFIGYKNGDIVALDTDDGSIYTNSTVKTYTTLEDMKILNGGIVLRMLRNEELLVMRYQTGEDLLALPDYPAFVCGVAAPEDGEYSVLCDWENSKQYRFINRDGILVYTLEEEKFPLKTAFYGDRFVFAESQQLKFVIPSPDGDQAMTERTIQYADLGVNGSFISGIFSPSGRYLSIWGPNGIAVIDLEKEALVYADAELTNLIALAYDESTGKILISDTGMPLRMLDVASGESTSMDEACVQTMEFRLLESLKCDPTGRYAAMACADGYVRVLSLSTGETVLSVPVHVNRFCFLAFTKDGENIILQGDEFQVRIYNLADGTCRSSFDVASGICFMAENEDQIALGDSYSVILIDAKSFGRLAYVQDGRIYNAKERWFLLSVKTKAWIAQYRPYTSLLEEAKKQFPGSVLSDEKKVKYNID